ncbi:MAG: GNAT family N-acetyltransferase [Saprospiraceae bacterium]
MIRPYSSSDQAAVIRIFKLNTPTYFAPEEQKDLEEYLAKFVDQYWVIEQDGEIVGCGGINFNATKTEGRISWDFLTPECQGLGLGRKLTAFRLAEIRKVESVKKIVVRTSQLAYAFYAKFGFETLKIKKNYWAPGLDLYHMEMEG